VAAAASGVFYLLRFDFFNRILSALVIRGRDLNAENKPAAEKAFKMLSVVGKVHDEVTWKVYSIVYVLRKVILLAVIAYLYLRRRGKIQRRKVQQRSLRSILRLV